MNDRKPKTFADWHKIFCNAIGIERVEYKPNKLKNPDETLRKLFGYLL